MFSSLLASSTGLRSPLPWKPRSGFISFIISRAPRLLVRKMRLCSKLTVVLSPSVSVARSRMPSSSVESAGAAFSISSNSTIETGHSGEIACDSFSCVSTGCVSRCPR